MVKSKIIGAKIPLELYHKIEEYKQLRKIDTDSEALRDILRSFFFERGATDGSVSSTNQG